MTKASDADPVRRRRTLGVVLVLALLAGAWSTATIAPPASAAGEPQVTVADITVEEPLAGEAGSMDFPVTLEFPSSEALSVPWRLAPGKPPYLPSTITSGTLVFEPGETEKTLSFPLAFDPDDDTKPYYYTVHISPDWRNLDIYGVATILDTTRNGEFTCHATAYLGMGAGPAAVPSVFSGTVGDTNCVAGLVEEDKVSYDAGHFTAVSSTMEVVRYADNSVYTQPAAGDGGEAHVRLTGVVWRIAPGLVLRIASIKSDARIVCTEVGQLPLMEAASEVKGLSINGAPPLGTITDERFIDLGGGSRIVLNRHQDQAVTIAGGPQVGEPHRTIRQVAVEVAVNGSVQNYSANLGTTSIGQLWGNPCNA